MKRKRLLAAFVLTAITLPGFAQDRQFARTYQSLVLPKGVRDIEIWSTFRGGREIFYRRTDQRIEFEVGLTDKLQTAFYLNSSFRASGPQVDTLSGITKTSSFSFSNEWKFKLSDPVANGIGSALYGEITWYPHEYELEGKLILDKKAGKNLFAFNAVGEYEVAYDVKKGEIETEWESVLEFDFGYMYLPKKNFGVGLELRNHNVITVNGLEHAPLFGGPTLFFSREKYFIILNILPQWVNLYKPNPGMDALELSDHEKIEVRLLIGFSL